ncbi:MAG: S8 family peptidase, partial [Rhodospirillaceae bacterium]|nr:S8 family peptidase [Rhodospirillaceae bacterium]
MPSIRPFPAIGPRGVDPRVHPPARLSPVYPDLAIAVFDGGLDNSASPPFFPFDETTLATDKPDPGAVRHGTAVTAAATFGLMVPGSQLPQPLARLDHYRIHPPDGWPSDLSVVWVLDEIERVTGNEDYTIVNLSYGPDQAVEADNEPDRWTVLLDQVAYERDVLFVVAAGNNGQAPDHLGLNRVQVPADGANVLSVGACDRPDADPWAKAPYSAVGPGRPGARIQPTGVQFGGVLDNNPFLAMTPDGRLADEQGTSFAAPIVTHALTGLAVRLGAHVRPALLRALAVHYARPHRHHHKHRRELGYGRFPLSFDDVLDCDPGEVSLVYQDTIGRNEIIAYSIPIPGGATGALKIAATLAVTSAVEPSQVTEYTRAAVELTLRPHAHRY